VSYNVVINELLCYVDNSLKKFASANVKTTIIKFYTDGEVSAAKKLLIQSFPNLPSLPAVQRQGERKKLREVDDIMQVFRSIDEHGYSDKTVRFAAVDLARVPSYTKEEECLDSVLARLSSLESQLESVTNLARANNKDISSLKLNPPEKDDDVFAVPKPSYAEQLKRLSLASASAIPVPARRPLRNMRLTSLASDTVTKPAKRLRSDAGEDDITDKPFVEIRRRKPPKGGKREGCTINGGISHLTLFVSHLQKDTTEDQLNSFLTAENIEVHHISATSHPQARFKSFKVTVNKPLYDKLCGVGSEDFWPTDVYCRPFRQKREDHKTTAPDST
jgi:hypothetical protein